MALFIAQNEQLQTIKGIYYAMTEDYINATLFHNLVPKTATEIKFLYASTNPDLTGYSKIGYCDNNNFIEVWSSETKYIIINPRKNYIYAPVSCYQFLYYYTSLTICNMENFNTLNVTDMQGMFYNCTSLTSIISNSFNLNQNLNSSDMFFSCVALVGGNGTTYSNSHTNAEYARVDGENGLAGYFTAPN